MDKYYFVFISLILLFLAGCFGTPSYDNAEDFAEAASLCEAATYSADEGFGTVTYISNEYCGISKYIKLNDDEPSELKELLEGKVMTCYYEEGSFTSSDVGLFEGLENCEGELAEAIGGLALLI